MDQLSNNEGLKRTASDILDGRLAILAGAGLSMLPPTSLPSGQGLLSWTLRGLASDSVLRRAVAELEASDRFQAVVPELIFQRLYEAIRDALWPAFEILKHATPSIGHQVVAWLCAHGVPVATTNFDLLIEACLSGRPPIAHFHGSLDEPAKMATRINQIGQGLDSQQRRFAREHFVDKTLLVVGYSGNDKDVMDALASSRATRVRWIVRSASSWATVNAQWLSNYVSVELCFGDLQPFFNQLASRMKLSLPDIPRSSVHSKPKLGAWAHPVADPERYACIFKAANELDCYQVAEVVLENAPPSKRTVHTRSWFLTEYAETKRKTNSYRHASNLVEEAIRFANSPSAAAAGHNVRGLILLEMSPADPKEAVSSFRSALALLAEFERGPDGNHWADEIFVFRGRIWNNLALALEALGRDRSAIKAHSHALEYKRRVGDIPGMAQTAVNLALAHYRRRRFGRAQYWKRAALRTIDKYQLASLRSELMMGLSDEANRQGRKAQAERYREAATPGTCDN